MNEIPFYLKDNPDYYIDWWENIITNLDIVKKRVEEILLVFNNINVKYSKIKSSLSNEFSCNSIKIEKDWLEIWYIKYNVIDEFWMLKFSQINDWLWNNINFNNSNNYKWEWYWIYLYISTALEALKNNKTFISDNYKDIKNEAKYIWNSLVNLWFVEYDENIKRFKFINGMLEDYFIDKIKNTD